MWTQLGQLDYPTRSEHLNPGSDAGRPPGLLMLLNFSVGSLQGLVERNFSSVFDLPQTSSLQAVCIQPQPD